MDKNIGLLFSTWRLINPSTKRYYYKCRCIHCGLEKELNLYKLRSGNYAACSKCGHDNLQNLDLIKKHWNPELNKKIISDFKKLSLSKKYWFICNKGHNFKSNLKDFSLDNCSGCKGNLKSNSDLTTSIFAATELIKKIYRVPRQVGKNILTINDKKIAFLIREKDRFENYKNYYYTEEEYLEDFIKEKEGIKEIERFGMELYIIYIDENISNTLDQILEVFKNKFNIVI